MKTRYSKTKNFEVYRILLNFQTVQEALDELDTLSRQLSRHKNALISIIAQPQINPLIYKELKAYGYPDEQIPEWFIRPQNEEEPQTQTTDYTITIPNHSEQLQPVNSQITQTPQPRNFMGMQVYDWEEIQRHLYNNKPREPTVAERIAEEQYREYEDITWKDYQERKELRRRVKQEELDKKTEKELTETHDPWTALQILKKNPKWLAWYNSLTPQEQKKTYESISQIYRFVNENKIIQENQRQWNRYFEAMWWQGRFHGKW